MNSVDQLAFDQEKVLAWWTGRIANADLALWTGQTERDIRLILDTPFFRREIQGGGRGSKNTRRISAGARNAVAIVAALRKAGMSIETAAGLLNAIPVLAKHPTEVVDFSPGMLEAHPAPIGGLVSLAVVEPDKGWLLSDTVPDHIYRRMCRPIVKQDAPEAVEVGEIAWLPDWQEELLKGKLPDGWRSFGEPMYRPEIDPLGFLDKFGASDQMDFHIYIIDGRWVWDRHQTPDSREYAVDIFQWLELKMHRRFEKKDAEAHFSLIAEACPQDRSWKTRFKHELAEKEAKWAWKHPQTKLDVNATMAVREMKRVAYGLVPPP